MKRFEFSYRDKNDDMHFVVVFDETLDGAVERVLCREVKRDEFKFTGRTWFITGWENTHFAIKETEYFQPSSHVVYNPKVNSVLKGLI